MSAEYENVMSREGLLTHESWPPMCRVFQMACDAVSFITNAIARRGE